jgi:protein-S-isoprenylcysteine O-methyltransferase Ste14
MDNENAYRVAVLLVFALAMPIAVYHRLRARTDERISRQGEGLALAITLRLAGLVMWLSTLAYLLNPAWMDWAQLPLPAWLRWCGAPLGVASIALLNWTLQSLGKNLTDTVATRQNATLVTHGPYHYVRHPFYVCTAGLTLAATLLSANAVLGVASAVAMVLLVVRMPKEEQQLLERFGEPYRHYRATTGAFFPKLLRSTR